MKKKATLKLSQTILDTINALEGDPVTFQQITDQLGRRAYGALIIIMSLPNFIPGVAIISALLLLIFSIQMVLGVEKPWLPRCMGQYSLQRSTLKKGVDGVMPWIERFEHYMKPRWLFMSTELGVRAIGVVIVFLSVIILSPIPLGNLVPSIALLFIAFGILQNDGLVVWISAFCGILYSLGLLWVLKFLIWSVVSMI